MRPTFAWVALVLLPWLVVLSVPELRLLLQVQTLGSTLMVPQYPWTQFFEGDAFNPQRLAANHPQDVRALAQAVDASARVWGDDKAHQRAVAAYDRLIRRFPGQPWLIAARLDSTLRWFRDDRVAGDLENRNRLVPPPEQSSQPPNFTPRELSDAIALARTGRQLEPRNAFWECALCRLLLAGYQDEEALRVIHTASLKRVYDDHFSDEEKLAVQVHEFVRPLVFEEKIHLVGHLSPPIVWSSHATRLISWRLWKEERAGQYARAITTRSDLARLFALMLQQPNSMLNGMVGAGEQCLAWNSYPIRLATAQARRRKRAAGEPYDWTRIYSQIFAQYATAHGQLDVARRTLQEGESSTQVRQQIDRAFALGEEYGTPRSLNYAVTTRWCIGLGCLAQCGLCLLLYAFLSLLLVRSNRAGVARQDFWLGIATAGATMLCGGCVATALHIGSYYGMCRYLDLSRAVTSPEEVTAVGALFVAILAPLTLTPCTCAVVTAWRIRNGRSVATPEYEGDSARHIPRSVVPSVLAFCSWSTLLVTLLCWIAALTAFIREESNWRLSVRVWERSPVVTLTNPAQDLAAMGMVLTVICVMGWAGKWRWLAPEELRERAHYALWWYRDTVGAWFVIASFLYLIVSASSLPVRHAAEARLNECLRVGEIAILTHAG